MAPHAAVRVGPEDGHAAARRRGARGQEGQEDAQVPAEHSGCFRSLPRRHAGERRAEKGLKGRGAHLGEHLGCAIFILYIVIIVTIPTAFLS